MLTYRLQYLKPADILNLALTCRKFNVCLNAEIGVGNIAAYSLEMLKNSATSKLRLRRYALRDESVKFREYYRERIRAFGNGDNGKHGELITLSWIDKLMTRVGGASDEGVRTKVFEGGRKTPVDGFSTLPGEILLKIISYTGTGNFTALAQTSTNFRYFFETEAAAICNGVIKQNHKAIAEKLECVFFQKFLIPTHPIIKVAEDYFLAKMKKHCGVRCVGEFPWSQDSVWSGATYLHNIGDTPLPDSKKKPDTCNGHLALHLSQPGPQFLLFLEKYGPFIEYLLKGNFSELSRNYRSLKHLMELFYLDMEQGKGNWQKLMKNLNWFYAGSDLARVRQLAGVRVEPVKVEMEKPMPKKDMKEALEDVSESPRDSVS